MEAYRTGDQTSYEAELAYSRAELAESMVEHVASGMEDRYNILEHMDYTYLRYEIKLAIKVLPN